MTGWENQFNEISNVFDQDHSSYSTHQGGDNHIVTMGELSTMTVENVGQSIHHYSDPLKYANNLEFKPLNLTNDHTHFVKPHYVDPYIRKDGTLVEGYFRDGDGNPNIDTPLGQGGGYWRSNPDGSTFNNLK